MELNINVSDELAALWEEIDFIAFVRDDTFVKRSKREARRIDVGVSTTWY